MVRIEEKSIEVEDKFDVLKARKKARKIAKRIGFNQKSIEEISIAVSELANNLISHTKIGGKLIFKSLERKGNKGIEIVCTDKGPSIYNSEAVIEDGFSTTGSLGIGLGAVNRLMNDLVILNKEKLKNHSESIKKKKIITRKYLSNFPVVNKDPHVNLKFGIFSRSKIGETYNGDGYYLKHFGNKILIALIDGLGHGKKAYLATKKVKDTLDIHYHKDLDSLITIVHKNLHHTRGVAACFVLFNKKRKILKYVNIGNVQARVYKGNNYKTLLNFNGTLGIALRTYKVHHIEWNKGKKIIMTSDGISSRFSLPENYDLFQLHPMKIAKIIFDNYGKEYDDATVIVGGV